MQAVRVSAAPGSRKTCQEDRRTRRRIQFVFFLQEVANFRKRVHANLGMHDGVVVVLPDVVVDEDVLDGWVKGVDPQRLPTADGEGVRGPPG